MTTAWICLANGIWWPAILIVGKEKDENCQSKFSYRSNLMVMKLCGTNTELAVDITHEESATILCSIDKDAVEDFFQLHQNQKIPNDFSADFTLAIKELETHLNINTCKTSSTSLDVLNSQKEGLIMKTTKREGAITWDDYFMAVAFLSAMRSKDPSTQVGACIVDPRKRVVGIGYNGFPTGCSDDILPWARTAEDELDTKYPYVVHAEVNAILNKISAELTNCSIYVGLFPCNECAKTIIQSGIREVVYLSDKYAHTTSMRASRTLFTMAGVLLRQYSPQNNFVLVNFASIAK